MREAGTQAVTVRPVRPSEHSAVASLTIEVYGRVLGDYLTDDYRAELADVATRAREAVVLVAVEAEDPGRLLGSVTYVPGQGPYAEFDGQDEAGVRMLVVAPHAQRRGVGTLLMRACVDQARADGRARVSLHTTPHMVGARELYEGMGFRRAPERDRPLEVGVTLLGYVLDLDG